MKPDRNITAEKNIRNRLIDVLQLFASAQDQLEYQKNVPHIYIPDEMINQWQDWVYHDRKDLYRDDVYTTEELEAIWTFDTIWGQQADLIDSRFTMAEMIESEPWIKLMSAAKTALMAFGKPEEADEVP